MVKVAPPDLVQKLGYTAATRRAEMKCTVKKESISHLLPRSKIFLLLVRRMQAMSPDSEWGCASRGHYLCVSIQYNITMIKWEIHVFHLCLTVPVWLDGHGRDVKKNN